MKNAAYVLIPPLISSGLAALVGAAVGGYITAHVVNQDTDRKLVASAYSAYLSEAVRAVMISHDRALTEEERKSIGRATGALLLVGSEDVVCWAISFEREAASSSPDADEEFNNLWTKMREEVLGEDDGVGGLSEECQLFDP